MCTWKSDSAGDFAGGRDGSIVVRHFGLFSVVVVTIDREWKWKRALYTRGASSKKELPTGP